MLSALWEISYVRIYSDVLVIFSLRTHVYFVVMFYRL